MLAYKLMTERKDGTIGPLFINKKKRIVCGEWMEAESHPTKGFSYRPFWHVTSRPVAPHLTEKNRGWYTVEIEDYTEMKRPESQGGKWYLAKKMVVIEKITCNINP